MSSLELLESALLSPLELLPVLLLGDDVATLLLDDTVPVPELLLFALLELLTTLLLLALLELLATLLLLALLELLATFAALLLLALLLEETVLELL